MRQRAVGVVHRGQLRWTHLIWSLLAALLTWDDLGPPFLQLSSTSYNLHLPSSFFDEAPPEHAESFLSPPSMNP